MSLNMADSDRGNTDYASTVVDSPAPMTGRLFTGWLSGWSFRPRLWPTLAAALLIPLFLAAGQWQWNKAARKAQMQEEIETLGSGPAIATPIAPTDAESLRFHRIAARGYYEPQFQMLIDNRTHRGLAGYHVITPLRLEGSQMRVLVNRGWVPVAADRTQLPVIDTPPGPIDAEGLSITPPAEFFTLATPPTADPATRADWQPLWQNLDMARFAAAVDFAVQPFVLQLEAQSDAGGFVRDWPRPDDRRTVNLGYALQWWSFAATTVVLWLVLNLRRAGNNRRSTPCSTPHTAQPGIDDPS